MNDSPSQEIGPIGVVNVRCVRKRTQGSWDQNGGVAVHVLPRTAFRTPALIQLATQTENRSCPREEPIGQLGDAKGSYLVGIDRRWGSPGQTGNAVELHHVGESQGAGWLLHSASRLTFTTLRPSHDPRTTQSHPLR